MSESFESIVAAETALAMPKLIDLIDKMAAAIRDNEYRIEQLERR